ncbi:MAG: hypothetical protein V4718_13885 [Pseudomonadota bacterium]
MKHLALGTTVLATLVAAMLIPVHAQNIERVKMTDNDLNCQQIYTEITQMDSLIAKAGQAAPGVQVASADSGSNVGGQVAGAVAQQAMATAVAQNPGAFGSMFGGLGGMFGSLANMAAQQASAQQAAAAGAAQQQAAQAQQNNALMAQQAQGRKEHLTGMFLSKGCKMSDVQK